MLTGYAESRFKGDAVSKNPTVSGYYSEGVFQQTLPWWTNDHWDVKASAKAFLKHFRVNSDSPVRDCWDVQRWKAPDHRNNLAGFLASPETKNYTDNLGVVREIIKTSTLPGSGS